jgi:sterol desaturase/sphingolipid hydroxylase (fatty acid hydroxylase superfamily)
MNEQKHQRAKELIAQQHVELLSTAEAKWLNVHLAECESCAADQRQLRQSLSVLRTIHLDLPNNLAIRTQFRVRMRAQELREKEPVKKFVWAIAAISWALGVATAPWVWRGVEWLGQTTGAPKIILQAGFVLWWSVPPMVAAWAALSDKRMAQADQAE